MTSYRYQGNGRDYIAGVSRRNLSEADVARLTDDQLEAVRTVKGTDGKRLYVVDSSGKGKKAEGDAAEAAADE